MKFSFSFHRYKRTFLEAFKSAYGSWKTREGFLVKLQDEDRVLLAEVCPIPAFGTETLEEAEEFLQALSENAFSPSEEITVPENLPCCAFAISSIFQQLEDGRDVCSEPVYPVAALLPAGTSLKAVFKEKLRGGFSTFKWKVGVDTFEEESALFSEMLAESSPNYTFRLDANASLTEAECIEWLKFCQRFKQQVEFFEQPMKVGLEPVMARLAQDYGIPIALDESLNARAGSKWLLPNAWEGPLVVKPCLLGSVTEQINRFRAISDQLVFSSAFETSVGLNQLLALKAKLGSNVFALGVDTRFAFNDSYALTVSEPEISRLSLRKSIQVLTGYAF
jgi:O-succinylbenzoate synthase